MAYSNFTRDPVSILRDIETGAQKLESTSSALPPNMTGMSGRKFRTLVCELVSAMKDGCYLEIGAYRGKTVLTSALANENKKHVAVDNFSQFDPNGINLSVIRSVGDRLENFELFDKDFELLLRDRSPPKAGVYFFDASHDYRSQIIALINAPHFLASGGVILVDDVNYHHVRFASYDFVTAFPDFKLVGEIYTGKHPATMTPEEKVACLEGWWNGVHMIVHDPGNTYENLALQWDDSIKTALVKHGKAGCDSQNVRSQIISV